MCSMDSNLKDKFLAGNIYHQFKSICRDIDEFVSKDTMNRIENSVQSVGVTVKRFYSNAMQDMCEQVDMQDHLPVTGINSNSTHVAEDQLFLKQGSMPTSKHSDESLSVEADQIVQFCNPSCENPYLQAETSLHLRDYCSPIVQNCEESSVEEDIRRDPIPVTDNSSLVNHKFSTVSDEEDKSCTLGVSSSPAFSSPEAVLTTNKMETRAFDHQNEEELGVTPSTCCTPQKCSSTMESTSAATVVKAEKVFNCYSECDGCAYNLSTPSPVTTADETKDIDVLPASPILENESTYEAIDLSPVVKDDGRSMVWDSNFVHSTSYKRKNFRYYKKLIQNALTSRKRLSKEYEHLAIMYGDIDVEPHLHFEPKSTPSFPNNSVKIHSSQDMSEMEWELL